MCGGECVGIKSGLACEVYIPYTVLFSDELASLHVLFLQMDETRTIKCLA